MIFIFKRHSINCDKPALTLETWWFCFLYIILENINSRESLCPTEVQHYLSKIPPRQFSQAPHIASRTDVFLSLSNRELSCKINTSHVNCGRKKKVNSDTAEFTENVSLKASKTGQSSSDVLVYLGKVWKAIMDPYIHNHPGVIWVFPELEFHSYIGHPKAAVGPGDPLSSFPLCQKPILRI